MNRIFHTLQEIVPADYCQKMTDSYSSEHWTAVETADRMGIAMTVPGIECREFALLNSYFNHGYDNYVPFENYCTTGIDFSEKTVGVVGHLREVKKRHAMEAKEIFVFELQPKCEDDLPAELEDELLPQCDIVVITGSSLVNGTLPHLLELCPNAYTILTGPSVPQCRALLDFGIDRIAGLCITDIPGLRNHILNNIDGSPYRFGVPFEITK